MEESIVSQIMALKEMPMEELQKKHKELFNGKEATSKNKTYLWKRIAYRIQEMQSGGLPEESRVKLEEFVKEYDPINNSALRPVASDENKSKVRNNRLPIPGTIITKEYKGAKLQVKVLEKGFEYNGKVFKTLTGLTKEITGIHWSGYEFFNL